MTLVSRAWRPGVVVAMFALAGPAAARQFGVIEGIVTDTSLAPLASAEIVLVSSGIRVRTGENGHFRVPGLAQGSHILIVRRIGFFPASMIVRLLESDTVRVSFALTRAPQEIEAVTVMGERGDSLRLLQFEYRRRDGKGRYMTKSQIDGRRGAPTAELLMGLGSPLVKVRGDSGRVRWFVGNPRGVLATPASGADSATAARLATCEPRVFLNGVALPTPVATDDLPASRDLVGIEVYRRTPPPIPLRYGGLSACGSVIMLWTTAGA